MNPSNPADAGLVTLPCAHRVSETIERLKSLLSQKMIQVFADIDHAEGAHKTGLSLRPTRLLIFDQDQVVNALGAVLAGLARDSTSL